MKRKVGTREDVVAQGELDTVRDRFRAAEAERSAKIDELNK